MSLLPKIKQADKTWHGIDGRFSSHYSNRFYADGSLAKAQKARDEKSSYYLKEKFYNEEIEKINRNRFVLLNISQEKEKFERIKKKVLTEKRAIGKKIKHAVVLIQKHIRGYLCRKHHEAEMEELKKSKLGISVKAMNRYVGKCCIYLADNIVEASIVIQKYMRRYLAKKLLARLKVEDKAARKIIKFFKVLVNRTRFKKSLESLKIKFKLKEIKHRLRWIRVKAWWKINRTRFRVIRQRIKSRKGSYYNKTPSRRSRPSSNESRKRKKSVTAVLASPIVDEGEKQIGNLLDAPLGFEKIEEVANEESLSLTLTQFVFQPPVVENPENVEEKQDLNESEELDEGSGSEISESIEEELEEPESSQSLKQEDNELKSNTQELEEEELVNKEEKPKKPETPQEKPIPSYRKTTAAFNSWKKRPPSPEIAPKEIFPPPKHLLVWTKCRKIYKNQTKKHKTDLSYQLPKGKNKRPKWRPPITANDTQIRKLPKIGKKNVKIPDFLEPYTFVLPSETPDSPIKLNQDEDSDKYDADSDTSYEYEAADFRSTGLSTALPQLYSIVKSYGKNADAIIA